MTKAAFARLVVGAALVVVSCGSGGQAPDAGSGAGGRGAAGGAGQQTGGTAGQGAGCPTVPACGGDIVGTWKIIPSCLTATEDLSSACPGASTDVVFTFSGTLTYNADRTYSSAVTGNGTYHERFPAGCSPFGLTCAQLGALDAGTSGTCAIDATGACICDVVSPPKTTATTGTYSTTSDGTVTTMHDGQTSTSSYCVQGGVLHTGGDQGDGGLVWMGDLAFTKQ